MMYLCIIFISPLYFIIHKKWGAFILNAILYGLALAFLVSVIGTIIAPIFWALAVGHAAWHLRKREMVDHAEMIATRMAEKLSEQSVSPGRPKDRLSANSPVASQNFSEPSVPLSRFCTQCGNRLEAGRKFCPSCGSAAEQ